MKRQFLLWLVCLPLCLGAAEPPVEAWQAAMEAFDRGEWEEGIQYLDSLEKAGWCAPELFFNLGNAWLKEGEIGEAILYYRRALLWAPRSKEIRHNLQLARSRVRYPHPPLPEFFLTRWWKALATQCSATAWAVIVTVVSWLLVGMAFGWYRTRRVALLKGSVLLLAIWLLALGAGATRYRLETAHPDVVVLRATLARVGASEEAPERTPLPEGVELRRIDRIGEWVKVVLPDGQEGWVQRRDLGFVSAARE